MLFGGAAPATGGASAISFANSDGVFGEATLLPMETAGERGAETLLDGASDDMVLCDGRLRSHLLCQVSRSLGANCIHDIDVGKTALVESWFIRLLVAHTRRPGPCSQTRTSRFWSGFFLPRHPDRRSGHAVVPDQSIVFSLRALSLSVPASLPPFTSLLSPSLPTHSPYLPRSPDPSSMPIPSWKGSPYPHPSSPPPFLIPLRARPGLDVGSDRGRPACARGLANERRRRLQAHVLGLFRLDLAPVLLARAPLELLRTFCSREALRNT